VGRLSASVRGGDTSATLQRFALRFLPHLVCTVQHRISPDLVVARNSSMQLKTFRGHTLVAHGGVLRVFNSSRVQREAPQLLVRSQLSASASGCGWGTLLATATGPSGTDKEAEMRVSMFVSSDSTIQGFEALLSTRREPSSDFNWFRFPM
jgi:hypothetical protein